MLKLLAAFVIAINPLIGYLSDKINLSSASKEMAIFDQRLPPQEDAFVISQMLPIYPTRNWNISEPEIPANIALVLDASRNVILFQKNGIFETSSVASLTKLMTALVTLDNADLSENFYITKKAVATYGEMGNLRPGEELSVKSLLAALLIASSNDAAVALAQNIGAKILGEQKNQAGEFSESSENVFIELMNKKAVQMHLKNTSFADPSGLDQKNESCAWDIARLMQTAASIPVLREIMQIQSINLISADGRHGRYLTNTNKLLALPQVIGGKTGYTEEAGNCMALAAKTPDGQEMLLIVIMGADDRLAETKKLLEWTKEAYLW